MYEKIVNKIFQNVWYFLIKGLVRRKTGPGTRLEDYAARFICMIQVAKLFEVIFNVRVGLILYGDSNEEFFAQFRFMKRWPVLAINIAIGGMRADSWNDFFNSPGVGQWVYAELRKFVNGGAKVIQNVGGNNVLQRQMNILEPALVSLKKLMPESFACTTPPIHLSFFAALGWPKDVIETDIKKCNSLIAGLWGQKTIDLYQPFIDASTGEAYPFILRDMVHWSDFAETVILNEEKRILA